MRNKYEHIIQNKMMKGEWDILMSAMPDLADPSRVSCSQLGDGTREYSFNQKRFLTIYPLKVETINDEDSIRIKASFEYRVGGTKPSSEVEANARLIAAAPDLLHEMEKLAQALEDTGHEPPQSYYEAIKKIGEM